MFFLFNLDYSVKFVFEFSGKLGNGHSSVADIVIKIIHIKKTGSFGNIFDDFIFLRLGERSSVPPKLLIDFILTFGNVFFTFFFFEPLPDFIFCLARFYEFEPITAWSF